MRRCLIILAVLSTMESAVVGGLGGDWIVRRGDANSNGVVDATDGVFINNWLFNGGNEPPCLNQADVDHDGDVTITDSSYLFNWLFLGGPRPPSPGPNAYLCTTTTPYISCDQTPCD